jgi:hypothetical protein
LTYTAFAVYISVEDGKMCWNLQGQMISST